MSRKDLTLLTDFYELTMMQGYYKEGQNETVVFDVFFRNNPSDSGYSICAGLAQVIEYIKNLILIGILIHMCEQHLTLSLFLFWLKDWQSVLFLVDHDLFDDIHSLF